MSHIGRIAVPSLVAAAAGLAVALLAPSAPGARADDEPAAARWTPADLALRFPDPDAGLEPASFAGSERCVACHEERDASLRTSFHAAVLTESPGCEACHGAGREHSDTDGDERVRHPLDVPSTEMNAVCLRCHAEVLTRPVKGHRAWTEPDPAADEPRPCTDCHEIHVDRAAPAHDPAVGPFRDVKALAAVAESIPARRCIACHADYHPQMARSGHANLVEDGAQCGTCHGNGSLHEASGGRARLIINPEHQPAAAADATCNTCHGGGAIVQRWTCSEHAREGVACIACHDANAPRGRTLRAAEYDLCGDCHMDVKASFRLPNRHKVDRGRVLCSDCHDPHANRDRVRDRDVRVKACGTCHQEKVGPFLHDHGIKRTEGCIACHDPHGSVNDRMLTHARTKPLCLQCHPETRHDLADRKYDNCISCHVEIHGSDLDRYFLR